MGSLIFENTEMTPPDTQTTVYPPIEPYRSGRLAVDEIHTLYWE